MESKRLNEQPSRARESRHTLDAETERRLEQARQRWTEKSRRLTDAIDRSERITEADLAVRINAKD